MERQKFEQEVEEAFRDAEAHPSDNVWTHIELSMEKEEGSKMRRRILFFKLMAAASVAFAFLVGSYAYYQYRGENLLADEGVQLNARTSEGAESAASGNDQQMDLEPIDSKGKADQAPVASISRNDGNESGVDPTSKSSEFASSHTQLEALGDTQNQLVESDNRHQNSGIERSAGKESYAANEGSSLPKQKLATSDPNVPTNKNEQQLASKTVQPSTLQEEKKGEDVTNLISTQSTLTSTENGSQQPSDLSDRKPMIAASGKQPASQVDHAGAPLDVEQSALLKGIPLTGIKPKIGKIEIVVPYLTKEEAYLLALEERNKNTPDDKKKEQSMGNLWASVGVSSGAFASTIPSTGFESSGFLDVGPKPNFYNTADQTYTPQVETTFRQFGVGVRAGGQLSKRLVLQGGINYLTMESNLESTPTMNMAFTMGRLNYSTSGSTNAIEVLSGQSSVITNQANYLSIPMELGYIILKKKVGVQLSGGLAADVLVNSKAESDANSIVAEPLFRSFNLNGLLETEVSYSFARRYMMAIAPGVRYPLNSIFEDGIDNPISLNVGLNFRYIFK